MEDLVFASVWFYNFNQSGEESHGNQSIARTRQSKKCGLEEIQRREDERKEEEKEFVDVGRLRLSVSLYNIYQ